MTEKDPVSELTTLQALRDTISDPTQRAALDAAIAALAPPRDGDVPTDPPGEDIAEDVEGAVRQHTNSVQDYAQVGASIAGSVQGSVVAPLFPAGTGGNYIAEVINLYGVNAPVTQADYSAALRRYLEHVYARHATIDLRGIDDRPMDMPLSELYVSLTLYEPLPLDMRGAGGLRGFIEQMRDMLRNEKSRPAQAGSTPRPVVWTQALQYPRIVVVGGPGSGKTTLLHYTAIRLAEVLARDDHSCLNDLGFDQEPPVPLLLPLRELGVYLQECGPRAASPRLLLDCLANYYNGFQLDLTGDFFSRLCDEGRVILLLDGLDEVARSEDRVFVSAVVREFVLRYPHCRYVVTTRTAAYRSDAQIDADFRICTVADLSEGQQLRFITNWSRSLHRLLYNLRGEQLEQASAGYSDDLWKALRSNERVRMLAGNPLLLTVVAVIFYNNYVLPDDRASLYEECIEVLLRGGRGKVDRAAQQRAQYGGKGELSMGLNPRRELLAAIAYTMHQRGEDGLFVSRDELIRIIADYLQHRRPNPEEAARIFVDEMPVHIGLLDEREVDRFRFSHLSFQEFLAARHIAETDRWNELLSRYQDSWWREVILLCAGHLSQERCRRFLDQLIRQGQTAAERSETLELAALILADIEDFKGQGPLIRRIIADALSIQLAPHALAPAAARVTCGRVLAQFGDPRSGICGLPPAMVQLPGVLFLIGNTSAELRSMDRQTAHWLADTINPVSVHLTEFEIARYLVTNAQYARFIADGGYDPDQPWWSAAGRAWLCAVGINVPRYWEHPYFGRKQVNHPVVGISWYEAQAFCRWLTRHPTYNPEGAIYRLPNEGEWEYAARGAERRPYPWGFAEPDDEYANFQDCYGGTTAVRSFPSGATPNGIYDLAGNVWEWTNSVYRPYPYDPYDGREQEDAPADKHFVIRGGSWNNLAVSLRASGRYSFEPEHRSYELGFRLAHSYPIERQME